MQGSFKFLADRKILYEWFVLTLLRFIKYYMKFIYFDIFETAVYMKKLQKTYLVKVPNLFLAKRGCLTILCERFGYFLKSFSFFKLLMERFKFGTFQWKASSFENTL